MTESAGKGITYFLAKNWWLTMIRGLAALGLGLGLFAWPEVPWTRCSGSWRCTGCRAGS